MTLPCFGDPEQNFKLMLKPLNKLPMILVGMCWTMLVT